MKYINKKLTIERVSVQAIANKYNTPTYCYSFNKLKENIINFKNNFKSFSPLICFAIKSNTNVNLIREIKKFGLGADVVSKGELMTAIKAGINPEKTIFFGLTPAFKAIISSPFDTTSAPSPNFFISLIRLTLVLDLTAKQINGEKDLKFF